MEIARFDVEGVPAEYRDALRRELTEPWGFGGKLEHRDSQCLTAADADAFGRLGRRPEPPGWQQKDCAFTRRANSRTSIDVAGQCATPRGSLTFTVAGIAARQSTALTLTFDERFSGPDLQGAAHWEIVGRSRYAGPCEKRP